MEDSIFLYDSVYDFLLIPAGSVQKQGTGSLDVIDFNKTLQGI